MGQYWIPVCCEKREFIDPHRLGSGLKLWEILANTPGVGAALVVLCAAMPERRGGGDLDLEENWHGKERDQALSAGEIDGCTPGPMPDDYEAVARRTIGRWAGCKVALVGDYALNSDLPGCEVPASEIYGLCDPSKEGGFTDISDDVCRVIEHELNGTFTGTGWREWAKNQRGA